MSLLRRLSVLALLALWLAATQHCVIEASGVLDFHAEHAADTCCAEDDGCALDSCDTVEGAFVRGSTSTLKVPEPSLHVDTCPSCLFVDGPPGPDVGSAEPPGGLTRAVDWLPAWSFEHRAAPSPRAPSVIAA